MKINSIQQIFKPWIVRRPRGNCQIVFALTELDDICGQIKELYGEVPLFIEMLKPILHQGPRDYDKTAATCRIPGQNQNKGFEFAESDNDVTCLACLNKMGKK